MSNPDCQCPKHLAGTYDSAIHALQTRAGELDFTDLAERIAHQGTRFRRRQWQALTDTPYDTNPLKEN